MITVVQIDNNKKREVNNKIINFEDLEELGTVVQKNDNNADNGINFDKKNVLL